MEVILCQEKERDLSKHLGLQEISLKSQKRMQLIKGLDDESDDCDYKGKSKEKYIYLLKISLMVYPIDLPLLSKMLYITLMVTEQKMS